MTGLDIILIVLAAAFFAGMIRAGIGPSPADRAIGTDVSFLTAVASLSIIAVRADDPRYFDAVIIATLLGFVATIALARLIGRKR